MTNDFLFFSASNRDRVEWRVINGIYECLEICKPELKCIRFDLTENVISISALKLVLSSRIIVLHSPLFYYFPLAIIGRLCGAEVWALVWDMYPVRLGGKRYDPRVVRRFADLIEIFTLKICNKIYVPTSDFKKYKSLSGARVLRMWPKFNYSPFSLGLDIRTLKPLKIIFSGQVNETRGLAESLEILLRISTVGVRLFIASADIIPAEIKNNPNVINLGYKSSADLNEFYKCCDFGLVSISSQFDGPAFPSKTFDYIANGLPVLYHGPDLSAFKKLLVDCGVGISLDSVDCINHETVKNMLKDFALGRDSLFNLISFTDAEIDNFVGF